MTTKIRRLTYEDRVSRGLTWQKVILMTPLWGLPLISLFGWLMSGTPELIFQAGHALVLTCCVLYFAEDLLKRTIKVKEDIIHFGYKRFNLADLERIGLRYKKDQITPDCAIFEFKGAVRLKLYLSRLKWSEFEDLLRHVENKVPHCKIDPVLLTLMKCKNAAGKSLAEIRDSVAVPYNSRKSIKELGESFMETADQWGKSGPVVLSVLASPLWAFLITGLYLAPRSTSALALEKMSVNTIVTSVMREFYTQVGHVCEVTGKAALATVGNNIAVMLMLLSLLPIMWWVTKLLLKPNLITVDSSHLTLRFRLYTLNLKVGSIPLREITAARLVIPESNSSPENWMLRFERHQKKPVDLMLTSIDPTDKQQLLKAIEKWAPHVVMDAQLTEALLPKQERSYTELWLQSLTQAPERRSLEPLAPGQELQQGRFQIIRTLGIGGQGTAYLCKDTSLMMERLNTYVVLKETIFPVFVDSSIRQQALERFEKEATLLSRFDSDKIVRLSDYFLEDHRGYLVLEHVDGVNLRQLVEARGALPSDLIRDLARQMCDILETLHAEEIVHRDFTPDNLILTKEGQLKLIDFNVAHQTESGFSGTIVGKHAFLPPEQFRGKATFLSDIYAMGATLHFLLTGHDPEPITQSNPQRVKHDCDPVLAHVANQATFLDSKKRLATIQDVRIALEMPAETDSFEESDSITVRTAGDYVTVSLKDLDGGTMLMPASNKRGTEPLTLQNQAEGKGQFREEQASTTTTSSLHSSESEKSSEIRGEMSGGEISGGEMSGGEMRGEISRGEINGGEINGGEIRSEISGGEISSEISGEMTSEMGGDDLKVPTRKKHEVV